MHQTIAVQQPVCFNHALDPIVDGVIVGPVKEINPDIAQVFDHKRGAH